MDKKLKELVERVIQGEQHAFEELIKYKERDIFYIALHFSKPQDVEDNVQDALVKVYRDISKLRDVEHFNSWLYKVIMNVCNSRNRSITNRHKIAEMQSLDEEDPEILEALIEERQEFLPYEYLEKKEKREFVINALNELPELYRECLFLFYFQEMHYKEIAMTIGSSPKQVENYLRRGRDMLKKRLEKMQGTDFTYSVLPVGAIPLLTHIFNTDADDAFGGRTLVNMLPGKDAPRGPKKGLTQPPVKGLAAAAVAVAGIGILIAVSVPGTPVDTSESTREPPVERLEGSPIPSGAEDTGPNHSPTAEPTAAPLTPTVQTPISQTPTITLPTPGVIQQTPTAVPEEEQKERDTSEQADTPVVPDEKSYIYTSRYIDIASGMTLKQESTFTREEGQTFIETPPQSIEKSGGWYDYQDYIWDNQILYYRYACRYTVAFETDNGSEITRRQVNYGNKIEAPPEPTKTGATFAGWYRDSICYQKWDFDHDTMPGKDITLYANWVSTEFTITVQYIIQNGDTIQPAREIKSSYSDKVDIHVPQVEGYYLDKWELNGVVQDNVRPIIKKLNQNVTVTLVYQKVK